MIVVSQLNFKTWIIKFVLPTQAILAWTLVSLQQVANHFMHNTMSLLCDPLIHKP